MLLVVLVVVAVVAVVDGVVVVVVGGGGGARLRLSLLVLLLRSEHKGSDGSGRPISDISDGIPTAAEYKARYEQLAGFGGGGDKPAIPASTWRFLQAFQLFRKGAIDHGVFVSAAGKPPAAPRLPLLASARRPTPT